jgi:hypothetical protein
MTNWVSTLQQEAERWIPRRLDLKHSNQLSTSSKQLIGTRSAGALYTRLLCPSYWGFYSSTALARAASKGTSYPWNQPIRISAPSGPNFRDEHLHFTHNYTIERTYSIGQRFAYWIEFIYSEAIIQYTRYPNSISIDQMRTTKF